MPVLEVFFDYICPHCLRGHNDLIELLPQFPDLDIEWRPCEAHPRPEGYGMHSDLCARGMFFASEHGADLLEYHRRMYKAAQKDHADIENVSVLLAAIDGLLNQDQLREALSGKCYEDKLHENNRLAWDTYGFPAVPSYRMDGETLKSRLGVGVSKKRLAVFLNGRHLYQRRGRTLD